jgi:hypothetical protein
VSGGCFAGAAAELSSRFVPPGDGFAGFVLVVVLTGRETVGGEGVDVLIGRETVGGDGIEVEGVDVVRQTIVNRQSDACE